MKGEFSVLQTLIRRQIFKHIHAAHVLHLLRVSFIWNFMPVASLKASLIASSSFFLSLIMESSMLTARAHDFHSPSSLLFPTQPTFLFNGREFTLHRFTLLLEL